MTIAPELDDCDVKDRAKLIQYRAKREEWLGWYELRKDEPNSIQQQLFTMIFIDLAYRILVKPRRNTDANLETAAGCGLLAHFLDLGYVSNQILAIRKLLDRRGDVISVRHLLDDICCHQSLLTREIYVCFDGLPYDYELWQSAPESVEKKIWGIRAPGLGKYLRSQMRHEAFDRLSALGPSQRQRTDLIREVVFDRLNQWLKTSPAEKLIALSHKFFAHAADTDSRGSLEYSGIELADVAQVQRAIIRVERAITDELLSIGVARDVVPMPPLGLLKGLDSPYASPDSVASMNEAWDQLTDERNKWTRGVRDELCS